MCWPRFEGGLEIEERYPRTNDPREPRNRRLNFVRRPSSSARDSNDRALMYSSFHQTRPLREEMRERHDPHLLQQQEHYMRQLQGHNQELQGQLHEQQQRLMWEEEQRRRFMIEQAHQNQQHPPPPPPPHHGNGGGGMIAHHPREQQRIMHDPHHEQLPEGIVRVEEVRPHIVEARPRSRLPSHVRHNSDRRSRSRGRNGGGGGHRHHHSGDSVYSDDRDSFRYYSQRRHRGRSPTVHGSSHDSFDDLLRRR